jgi:hypothetical protein
MVAGLESDSSPQFQLFAPAKRKDGKSFSGIRLPPNSHCFPDRRYVIRPQLIASDSSESIQRWKPQKEQGQEPFVAGIIDRITCLCLGGLSGTEGSSSTLQEKRREKKGNAKKSSTSKKKIVYPIANYPARLNSKRFVDQRRRSVQRQNPQQHFFRPVSEDEFDKLKTRH